MFGTINQNLFNDLTRRASLALEKGDVEPGVAGLCSMMAATGKLVSVYSCEGHDYQEYLRRGDGLARDQRMVVFAAIDGSEQFFQAFSKWLDTISTETFRVCRPELQLCKLTSPFSRNPEVENTYHAWTITFLFHTQSEAQFQLMKQSWENMEAFIRTELGL